MTLANLTEVFHRSARQAFPQAHVPAASRNSPHASSLATGLLFWVAVLPLLLIVGVPLAIAWVVTCVRSGNTQVADDGYGCDFEITPSTAEGGTLVSVSRPALRLNMPAAFPEAGVGHGNHTAPAYAWN